MEVLNIKGIKERLCPKCKKQFSQRNIPRILQCGHTFCQKCIKDMMVKTIGSRGKNDIIICKFHNTKTSFQEIQSLHKNTPAQNLAKQNTVNSSKTLKIEKKGQSGSIKHSFSKQSLVQQAEQKKSRENNQRKHVFLQCQIHNIPMQLVCPKDFETICSSCAIFGQHKGHEAMYITEIEKQAQSLRQKLDRYLKQQKKWFERLSSKELTEQVQKLGRKRKKQLQLQVNKKLRILLDEIQLMERETLHKLDKVIQQQKSYIINSLFEIIRDKESFKFWQESLEQKISSLADQNYQKRWKVAFTSTEFLESCQKNITLIRGLQPNFLKQTAERLNKIQSETNQEEIKKCLKKFCNFSQLQSNKKEMRTSRIVTEIKEEQILLDDGDINYNFLSSSFVKLNEIEKRQEDLQKSTITRVTSSGALQTIKTPLINLKRVKSSSKQNCSQSPEAFPNKQHSNMKTIRTSKANSLKIKTLPPKYQQNIKNIINRKVRVLDLSNGGFESQLLLDTMERIKNYSITQMRLSKNGINDDSFEKFIPYMEGVVKLNISKNQISQQSLNKLLNMKKQGGLKTLQYILATENDKIEKKYKQKVEQFKKLGISITLS